VVCPYAAGGADPAGEGRGDLAPTGRFRRCVGGNEWGRGVRVAV